MNGYGTVRMHSDAVRLTVRRSRKVIPVRCGNRYGAVPGFAGAVRFGSVRRYVSYYSLHSNAVRSRTMRAVERYGPAKHCGAAFRMYDREDAVR